MNLKKAIISVMLIIGVICGSLSVSAVNLTYNASEAYRSSKYYNNLKKVELSGDEASDVVAVALSQLGYHEGDSDSELHGLNISGSKDFAEYNVLYGKLDNNQGNGLSYGYYWCASFVNWCLRQAGVSKAASAAAEVSCHRWLKACKESGIYRDKAEYTPKKGDLVFFNDGSTEMPSSHMGIVVDSRDGTVITIEGNTSNGSSYSDNGNYVAIKTYSLESRYIVGYASPDYEKKEILAVDHFGKGLSAGQYISESNISAYSNPEMTGELTEIGMYEIFDVITLKGEIVNLTYEKDGKKLDLWADIRGKARQMTAEQEAYSVAFLDGDGKEIIERVYRMKDEPVSLPCSVPKKENCGFVGWTRTKGDRDGLVLPGSSLDAENCDVELWALWDTTLYTVTFKTPEGSIIDEISGYLGSEYEPPIPDNIPMGCYFAGWGEDTVGKIIGNSEYVAEFLPISESSDTNDVGAVESQNKSEDGSDGFNAYGCRMSVGAAGSLSIIFCALLFRKNRKKQ